MIRWHLLVLLSSVVYSIIWMGFGLITFFLVLRDDFLLSLLYMCERLCLIGTVSYKRKIYLHATMSCVTRSRTKKNLCDAMTLESSVSRCVILQIYFFFDANGRSLIMFLCV